MVIEEIINELIIAAGGVMARNERGINGRSWLREYLGLIVALLLAVLGWMFWLSDRGKQTGHEGLEKRLGKVESGLGGVENSLDIGHRGLGQLESRLVRVEGGLGKINVSIVRLEGDVKGITDFLARLKIPPDVQLQFNDMIKEKVLDVEVDLEERIRRLEERIRNLRDRAHATIDRPSLFPPGAPPGELP